MLRAYVELAKGEFRRYSSYRLAVLAGVFTNSVFGFIRVSVLSSAILTAGGSIAGYSTQEVSTYVWLGQAFFAPIAMVMWTEIADRVKTGEIAVDLPGRLIQLGWWSEISAAPHSCPARDFPPLLVGAATVDPPSQSDRSSARHAPASPQISISFARFLINQRPGPHCGFAGSTSS
jgi:ABC-2 type transport system permease protein